MPDYGARRQRMVREQLEARGVRDPAVLAAMGEVPREVFVPEKLREQAYRDGPMPIGAGQTISQPFIVAAMVAALDLEASDRVLEVGAGSGYSAAVISRIAREVYAVERIEELAASAKEHIQELGYANVHILCGDGSTGWPAEAPFDAIVVAAAAPRVPSSLRQQLVVGGRLVIPVGSRRWDQRLLRVARTEEGFEDGELEAVRFVPLVGEEGWDDA